MRVPGRTQPGPRPRMEVDLPVLERVDRRLTAGLGAAWLAGVATVSRPKLVPYEERWPDDFRRIASGLRELLGRLATRIDHVGSTSVPGLAAKDVIDVQVSVAELDRESLIDRFESTSYEYVPQNDCDHLPPGAGVSEAGWQKAFFAQRSPARPVNVHVRIEGAANARYALLFRDYLREHPAAAAAYAEVKRKLSALEPPIEMRTYADLKDPVCDIVIAAAEDWAAQVGWAPRASDG